MSTRTNKAGIEQFQQLVKPHDYEVKTIEISEVLHLKSAVTLVAENTVLLNPEWVDPAFDGYRTIAVDPSEPLAANVLRVGKMAVVSRSHPRTAARLDAAGIQCRSVASSELAKAEGALTCCSLLFGGPSPVNRTNSILFALLISWPLSAAAEGVDEITLKDGSVLRGEITRVEDDELILDTDYADDVFIEVEHIDRIESDRQYTVRLLDGEKISGYLTVSDGKISVRESPPGNG